MKSLSILIFLAISSMVSANDAQLQSQLTLEAKAEAKKLGSALKQVLQAQMKTHGPVAALKACNINAPQIAHKINTDSDWTVGRTSLRIRNLANAPDFWEEKVLKSFQQQLNAGAKPSSLEFSEIVTTDNKRQFRYMKAIKTKKVCLTCHGVEIADSIETKIHSLYPQDKAIGYLEGEIRGAFTLSKTIH